MHLNSYPYRKATSAKGQNNTFNKLTIYTFKSKHNIKYIVNVEEYDYEVFIIKFHTKNATYSSRKYSILTEKYDARRIIFTCIKIGLEIYNDNKNASFGFIGAPTLKEIKRVKKLENTKRFKVYSNFATFFFSPDNFNHMTNKDYSSYLLINKNKVKIDSDYHQKVISRFTEIYDDPESFFNIN
jgi:hypothetical protein